MGKRHAAAWLAVVLAGGLAAAAPAPSPSAKAGAAEVEAGSAEAAAKDGAEAKRIARRVQERYDATEDLSADFNQELHLAAGGQIVRSEGRMYFAKPGRMRWEYDSPEPQTIIADGEHLWVHQPEDEQVLKAPLREAFHSDTPVSFLFGVARLERDFSPSLASGAPPGAVRLRLEPVASDRAIGVLFLDVDRKTWDIRAASIRDSLGNLTEVRLERLRRNQGLDRSLFVFERPPGTDVIEAPGS